MLRFGIIGCGAMGLEHIRNLLIIEHARVVAIADNTASMLSAAAQLLPGGGADALVTADYHQLLASPDVDAVVICTPNYHHIEILRELEASGKHVLVEKPFCSTVAHCLEAVEVAKRCEAKGHVLWVGMEYRYMPPIARLIKEVDHGTVGALRMLSIREHRFPFLRKVGDWNRFNRNTGGTLVEKCCHFFDLMMRIVKAVPVRVFAAGGMSVNHRDERYGDETPDILDNAFVTVEFDNGARAMLDLCMFAEASRHQEEVSALGELGKVEAFGEAHGASSDDIHTNLYIGRRTLHDWGSFVKPPPPPPPMEAHCLKPDPAAMKAGYHEGATFYELRAFMAAVHATTAEGGSRPACSEVSAHDGLAAVALGAAAHMSIEAKRSIDMRELGPDVTAVLRAAVQRLQDDAPRHRELAAEACTKRGAPHTEGAPAAKRAALQ